MSIGAIKGQTSKYKFNLVNFNFARWHQYEQDNWTLLDAILRTFISTSGVVGVWNTSTDYVEDDRVIDEDIDQIFICEADHTSPVSGSFAADRIANPARWSAANFSARGLGDWTTATLYRVNDFVVDNGRYAIANATHTSAATFDEDVTAGNWTVLIDLNAATTEGLRSTSSSSLAIGLGTKVFTVAENKAFQVGGYVTAVDNADPTTNSMSGVVTAYAGTSLTVSVESIKGSGTKSNWTVFVSGVPGPQGATGASGAGTGDVVGPAGVTASRIAIFNGTSGKLLGQAGVTTSDLVATSNKADAAAIRAGTADKYLTADNIRSAMAPVAVAFAASMTLSQNDGPDFDIGSLTANITFNQMSNTWNGARGSIRVSNGGTWTATFHSSWKRAGGSTGIQSGSGKESIISYWQVGATTYYSIAQVA